MKREYYPLSVGQRSIAYASLSSKEAAVNNIGGILLLQEQADEALLSRAIRLVVERNDAMRLRMVKRGLIVSPVQVLITDSIKQYISDDCSVEIGCADFSGCSEEEMEHEILEWNKKPLDIFRDPLYEFKLVKSPDGRQGVFAKVDHLATDAWMCMLMCREIIELYAALKNGTEPPRELVPFRCFLRDEQAYLKSVKYEEDRKYWLKKFAVKPQVTSISGINRFPTKCATKRFHRELGPERSDRIGRMCKEYNLSPASFFNCVMAVTLSERLSQTDVSFYNAAILRSSLREKKTCGPMVNSSICRTVLDPNQSFVDLCRGKCLEYVSSMRHMRYPMMLLMRELFKIHRMNWLSDILLSFQTARIQTDGEIPFETRWVPSGAYAIPFTMNIMDMDNTGRFILESEYQTACFEEQEIASFHDDFTEVIDGVLECPEIRVGNLRQNHLAACV